MATRDEEPREPARKDRAPPYAQPVVGIPQARPVAPAQAKCALSIAAMCLGIGVWLASCAINLPATRGKSGLSPNASAGERAGYAIGLPLIPVGMAVSAIVLGYRARSQGQGGLGMAKAGVILGVAYLAVLVCGLVGILILKRW